MSTKNAKSLAAKATAALDIDKADIKALVAWYNDNSGSTCKIKTFKDIETARAKCHELAGAIKDLAGGSSKPAKTKEKKEKTDKGEGTGAGRTSKHSGKFLYKAVDAKGKPMENPRREGTWGHKSFAKHQDGMTYEEYITAGGRPNDLAWDLDHGYLAITDEKKNPKLAAPVKPEKEEEKPADKK